MQNNEYLLSQLLLGFFQLLFSSVQIQDFTLFPHVLVVVTVHRRVSTLSDKTCLVESEVSSTSVSPSQWDLILLQVIFRNWRLVGFDGILSGENAVGKQNPSNAAKTKHTKGWELGHSHCCKL